MDLDRLRGLPGAPEAEAAWAGQATAGPGDDCDAQIVPIVTGRVDPGVLDRLAAVLLHGTPGGPGQACLAGPDRAATPNQPGGRRPAARPAWAERAARRLILKAAADLLSGPGGLASYLRTRLAPGTVASVSLPLDVGRTDRDHPGALAPGGRGTRPRLPLPRLRPAKPVAACQPHHIIPRAQGGPTCLTNLTLLCSFHHLVAVHRWGWGIVLHPDGTVTATSPDGQKTLHSHGPPSQAA